MNRISSAVVTAVAAAALGTFAAPALAQGTHTPAAPCAQQQKQVDDAQAALDRLTAVFARQKQHVAHDKSVVAHTHGKHKALAKGHLKADQAKLAHTRKAKKAQQQRLQHAEARLATCQAAHPAPTPAPTEPTV